MYKHMMFLLMISILTLFPALQATEQESERAETSDDSAGKILERGGQQTSSLQKRNNTNMNLTSYTFLDSNDPNGPVFNFIDISSTGTLIASGLDVASDFISLPFTFQFYGEEYTALIASVHGYLATDPTDNGSDFSNDCPLPKLSSNGGGARIYGLHDDLISDIYFEAFTTAPRQHDSGVDMAAAVFQWQAVHNNRTLTDSVAFQVIIYENSDIIIQFGTDNIESGSGSTTGIQNEIATLALTYACDTAESLSDNLAIWFLTETSPTIAVTPSDFSISLLAEDTSIQNLTITNLGAADLDYSITVLPQPIEVITDGSFEAGTPNSSWEEASTNYGTPLCDFSSCGHGAGLSTPSVGDYWAWFGGGTREFEEGSLAQNLIIPQGFNTLGFSLQLDACSGDANDFLEVLIDNKQVFLINATDAACNEPGHQFYLVDINTYADGQSHRLEFHSIVNGNLGRSTFAVDEVGIGPNCDWLTLNNTSGTIGANAEQNIEINIRPAGLQIGQYQCEINITSNDPTQPVITIPVVLNVKSPKTLGTVTFGETGSDDFESTTFDTHIRENFGSQNKNYGGTDNIRIKGAVPRNDEWRGLLKFDFMTDLTANGLADSTDIISAKVRLHLFLSEGTGTDSLRFYRVLRDWGEGVHNNETATTGEVTWNSAKQDGDLWTEPGGGGLLDRVAVPEHIHLVSSEVGTIYEFDLTESVKTMFANEENFGWLLELNEGADMRYFSSREFGVLENRPQLIIEALFEEPQERSESEPSISSLPEGFSLAQNYPNPFNPITTIHFSLPKAMRVTMDIYNISGRLVRTLISESMSAGSHSISWNSQDDRGRLVNSGVYLYRLNAEGLTTMRKMLIVK